VDVEMFMDYIRVVFVSVDLAFFYKMFRNYRLFSFPGFQGFQTRLSCLVGHKTPYLSELGD
jgi:hypothetical protein